VITGTATREKSENVRITITTKRRDTKRLIIS